uniref:Protein kinase domain-containing protein n=1 Tax=Acrobeloides nanus TaxID=290746 RepID=A0A914DUP6_9BILA
MDFIIDIMIKQKQLSPEEIEELKIKRDEFTILRKNLKIYYEFPLGQGASSSVYAGFLYGQSPLMVSTGLIETQRFQDCKVAVKVPSSFGQDETEQLFREIDSMKKIGYNKHVICMLGISLLSEKPAVVFDLAEKDLLDYVRSLKETIFGQIQAPTNIFFSILWQVARGMQYISSKNIVHRDLAARNVLLTDSFNAKIADFGLSFSTDSGSPSTTDLPKKLPIKWLAIEALLNNLGLVSYKDLTTEDLVDFLRSGNRLECPEAANKETYEMMLCCWKEDYDERPTFEQLVSQLREILKTTTMTYGYVESKEE